MSGGGSFSSDQTTLQKDTGAISLLRAGRARITSIQGRGEAGSVLLLHDAATTGAAAGGNLKATFKYDTEGLAVYYQVLEFFLKMEFVLHLLKLVEQTEALL